ncbi:MAG: DNA polymerase III subunit delta [Clostridia bacterium]|nr:DNA polymerase III subunit delta [Clostridia bacterium]
MKQISDNTKLIKEKISAADFKGLFLFTGEEDFARKAATDAFIKHFEKDPLFQLNMHIFDGKETPAEKISQAAEALPVMSEEKLIVVKNSGIFKSASESQKKIFTELFDNLPDFLSIVFDEDEIDGRSGLLKKAKTAGIFAEFKYKTHAELVTYCGKAFAKAGISVTPDVLSKFVFSCDEGLTSVNAEMDKLIAFAMDKKEVTEDDVDAIVKKSLKSRVFEMLDAMIEGRANLVLPMLEEMKILKEAPVKILVLIGRQACMLGKTRVLLDAGSNDIAAQLGLKPFIAQKYIAQARRLTADRAKNLIDKCLAADYSIKSGETTDWAALELLVADITSGRY